MSDTSAATQKFNYSLFRRVMSMVKPYKTTFYFVTLLSLVMAPMAVLRPKLLQNMVDDHIFKGDMQGMTVLACVVLGLLVVEVVLRYFFLYYADWLGQATIRDLRVRVFNHVANLNLSYFDKTPIGQRDRKSTRLNSSHSTLSRMPSSA